MAICTWCGRADDEHDGPFCEVAEREEREKEMGEQFQEPMVSLDHVMAEVMAELEKAGTKHPTWPKDMFRAHSIIGEEYGELVRAILHLEYEGGSEEAVRTEAIQTACTAIRFLRHFPTTVRGDR